MAISQQPRRMIVETAQIWYDAAKNPSKDCSAEMGLVNALNHTENALVAILDGDDETLKKLRDRLRDLRAA